MHAPRKITKRVAAAVIGLAIAAPAALAATGSSSQAVVHTHIESSGTVSVSGYDGGVALAPASQP
ncbi:MAG TPA: hypothetical protein VII87_09405 [Solirubrobacteraceae bacterium]|jgi:hypothetical protein